MDDWIDIFRGGVNTDSVGKTRRWTSMELDQIVANFNPSGDTVPIVIGHPADDASSPAYGWVGALRRIGDTLQARLRNLYPQFVEGVKAKLWPNRSVRLVKSGDGWALGHIGFLGASPPAIEGMTPVFQKYAEYCDFHCPNWQYQIRGKMTEGKLKQISDYIGGKMNEEELKQMIKMVLDQTGGKLTEEELNQLIKKIISANQNNQNELESQDKDNLSDASNAYVSAKIKQYSHTDPAVIAEYQVLRQQNQQLQKQLEIMEARYNQEKNQLWIETQVKSGRLLPSQIDGLEAFLSTLQKNSTNTVNFTAAGKQPASMEGFFRRFVETTPEHSLFRGVEYAQSSTSVQKTPYEEIIEARNAAKGGK